MVCKIMAHPPSANYGIGKYGESYYGRIYNDLLSISEIGESGTKRRNITSNDFIKKSSQTTISSNSRIKVPGNEGSLDSNYDILSSFQKSINSGARLLKPYSSSISSNSEIVGRIAIPLLSNAKIKASSQKSINSNSRLKKSYSGTISSDAIIVIPILKLITCNAKIKKTYSISITTRSYITNIKSNEIYSNAIIKIKPQKSILSDSKIRSGNPHSITCDYAIVYRVIEGIGSDYTIRAVGDITFVFSHAIIGTAYIKKSYSSTITSDAFIIQRYQIPITSDSIIKNSYTQTLNSIYYVKVLGLEGSLNSKAYIKQIYSQSLNSDLFLRRQPKIPISSDSYIKQTYSTSLTSNSNIVLIGRSYQISPPDDCVTRISERNLWFVFTISEAYKDGINMRIQIANDPLFTDIVVDDTSRANDQGFWQYYDESSLSWLAYPVAGVPRTLMRAHARFRKELLDNKRYWRVRGELYD